MHGSSAHTDGCWDSVIDESLMRISYWEWGWGGPLKKQSSLLILNKAAEYLFQSLQFLIEGFWWNDISITFQRHRDVSDTVSFHTLQLIYQNFGDRQIQIGVQGPQALDEITRMGTSLWHSDVNTLASSIGNGNRAAVLPAVLSIQTWNKVEKSH